MHTGASVGTAALFMDALYLLQQRFFFLLAGAGSPVFPGIVAGPGHAIDPAHGADADVFPVLLDECEDFTFRSEQNRMAFLGFHVPP